MLDKLYICIMITKILFYLFIIPISILPHKILYFISDFIYLILFKLIGYRKEVVLNNLKNSFPEKNINELNNCMVLFYKHLADLIVESIKGFTISENQLRKRLVIKNPDLGNRYAQQGLSVIFVGGHFNNWEMCAQAFPLYSLHNCIGIYKPLKNKFMNKKLLSSRSKYGLNLISMIQAKKSFKNNEKINAILFASDQNPSSTKKAHWLEFLNQDTAVSFGLEKYSKEFNLPVIFVSINKLKRGFYEVTHSLITESPNSQANGKITEDFTKMLEKDIINKPQYWLWSHKRWKHKRIN